MVECCAEEGLHITSGSESRSDSESVGTIVSDEDDSEDGEQLGGDEMSVEHNDHLEPGFEDATAMNDEYNIPLFCGSSLSRLDATLLFLNVCRTHKATNACISEMLQLLAKVILPSPNSLPTSEAVASRLLSQRRYRVSGER